jgi:hypothetical protein
MPLWVSSSFLGWPSNGTFCESEIALIDNNAIREWVDAS